MGVSWHLVSAVFEIQLETNSCRVMKKELLNGRPGNGCSIILNSMFLKRQHSFLESFAIKSDVVHPAGRNGVGRCGDVLLANVTFFRGQIRWRSC